MVNQEKKFTDKSVPSLSSCNHTCINLGILLAGEVEEKERLKILLKCSKFSFYVMVEREIFIPEK